MAATTTTMTRPAAAADPIRLLAEGSALLFEEARALDEQRWDDWLALYMEECEFWVPAWREDHVPVQDPNTEVSFIYCTDRSLLEDRVWRIKTGQSVSINPMPRTAHLVSNILLDAGATDEAMTLRAAYSCHLFSLRNRTQHVFFGLYRHDLVRAGGAWRIRRKYAKVMNDYVPSVLDVFSV